MRYKVEATINFLIEDQGLQDIAHMATFDLPRVIFNSNIPVIDLPDVTELHIKEEN